MVPMMKGKKKAKRARNFDYEAEYLSLVKDIKRHQTIWLERTNQKGNDHQNTKIIWRPHLEIFAIF